MQNSPNTGERSSKCVGATKLFSFPLQFWVLSTQNSYFFKKKALKSMGNYSKK